MERIVIDKSEVSEEIKVKKKKADIIKDNKKLLEDNKKLQIELNTLNEELDKEKNKYLYLLADCNNQKKRNIEKINYITKYKNEDILLDLLDIVDDFEREISITHEINPLYNKVINILHKYDVKAIYEESHNEFNDKYDNIITSINIDDEENNNKIVNTLRKGYLYKDKILRYEDVVIGKYENNKEDK